MKMTCEHQELLTERIAPHDHAERRQLYIDGDYVNSDRTKNLDRRYRWDLFWTGMKFLKESDPIGYESFWDADYLNDHIDTFLRKLVPTLDSASRLS
jgi:hypothetical protein